MSWYLVQTKTREERRAVDALSEADYTVYCPEMQIKKRRKVVTEIMFPGYLFIDLDLETSRWDQVKNFRGVVRIVKFTDYPLAISSSIIENIKLQTDYHNQQATGDFFSRGEEVRIAEGPFADLTAIYLCSHGKDRSDILMTLYGRMTPVRLKTNQIEKT